MMLRYATLITLILLVIGSGWLLNPEPEDNSSEAKRALNDGYYLLDATISDTNETGEVIYSLNAERIDHIPENGSVVLTELTVLYAGEAEEPWTIEARRGAMGATRDTLKLNGGVTIVSGETDVQSTTIRTEELNLDISSNVASTDNEVSIMIAGGELKAQGMQADLSAKKISLLSQVRGTFGDQP
ncbi:MAG: LPS export ABC transporter periplasmic protein LptC [Gammaproteobacteria bacterium]